MTTGISFTRDPDLASLTTTLNQVAGIINVQDPPYLALGNGIADDTAAIQAAIDTGLPVLIPPGTYCFSSRIVSATSGQVIMGLGSGNMTILLATAPGATIQLGNGSSYSYAGGLQNLMVEGNYRADVGVEMTYTSEYVLRDVRISHCNVSGLKLTRSSIDRFDEVVVGNCAANVDCVSVVDPVFTNCNFWLPSSCHFRLREVTGAMFLGNWFERAPIAFLVDNSTEDCAVSSLHGFGNYFLFAGSDPDGAATTRLLKVHSTTTHNIKIHRMNILGSHLWFEPRPPHAIEIAYDVAPAVSAINLCLRDNSFGKGPTTALVSSNTTTLRFDYGSNDIVDVGVVPLVGSGVVTGMDASGVYGGLWNNIRAPLVWWGPAGDVRDIIYTSDGVNRWFMRATADAESGGNAGTHWALVRRADDGTTLGNAILAHRDTGLIEMAGGAYVTGLWNSGPMRLGNYYFWMDSGRLRMKSGAPASASDGAIVPNQASAQADSTAAALADLVTDFNTLLGKLRTAGVLAP